MEQMLPAHGKKSCLPPAFLLPAAVFLLILWRFGILPFGTKTLLFSDLDTQYVEFMAEYRRMLLGQGSFFYTWHAGLGMNFPGLIAYYLASPFNFLLVLFPEDRLALAVSVITALKLACAGAAFARYLEVRFDRQAPFFPFAAAFYALNAFALGYAFNIMWLDSLIWLPLLCAGIERLLKGRRVMAGLTPVFALSFLSQFYMAWMTGAFCVLYLLTRLFASRRSLRSRIAVLLRFGLCAGIAAGISAFLLLPAFFVIKNNMGLLGQEFPAAGGNYPFFSILRKLFDGSFDGIKDCLPHISCGLPALIGLILFFTAGKIPAREKAAAAVSGGLLLFSFWFAPLDFIWHALDHPSWFPYRYAFLFCFWTLACASEGWLAAGEGKIRFRYPVVCLILLAAAFLSGNVRDVRFPVLNIAFLGAYSLILCLADERFRRVIFPLLCCAELLVNGGLILSRGYTDLADFEPFHGYYRALTRPFLPAEGEFWRMEKSEMRNYNDAMGIGYPGMSHFSSTASVRQAEFLKRLGFSCYATWCSYQGSTAASDAMLRIRYEFGGEGKTGSVPSADEVWEHPAQFPLFFFAGDDFARYDLFSDNVNKILRQNDLLKLLGGPQAEDFYREIPAVIVKAENLEPAGGKNYRRIDPGLPAYIEAEIPADPERSVYFTVPGASLNYNVFIEDSRQVISAGRDYTSFPVCLDGYADREKVRVRVETTKDSLKGGIMAYALDLSQLQELCEKLNAAAPRTAMTSAVSFRLQAEASAEDRLIVSSVPFDAGWQVWAGNVRLPLKMIHESVLGFILPAGTEEVTVFYRPYGWEAGLILSGCALLMWAVILILERRNCRLVCDKKID